MFGDDPNHSWSALELFLTVPERSLHFTVVDCIQQIIYLMYI